MKLGSFRIGDRTSYGIVRDGGVIDLAERTQAPSLRAMLAADGLGAAGAFANESPDHAVDEVEWLPPIVRPTHIIGIGLNTRSHFEETAQVMNRAPGDYPARPRLFMRSPTSLVGHKADILVPTVSEQLDYEGELALVIGKRCRNVSEAEAMGYVLGVTAANDGSVRDYQFHSTQVTAGKNFFSSGAIGPWLVTSDEIDFDGLTLTTRINGDLRQTLTMADLIFSFQSLVSYISQIYQLEAGDIILTGSPAGVGVLESNWLRDGDRVEIDVPGLGTLCNRVVQSA